MLFAAPPFKDLDWSDKGVEGSYRFLSRIWRFVNRFSDLYIKGYNLKKANLSEPLKRIRIELHRTIKIVTNDIEERMQYNTAIARMMELINALYQVDEGEWQTPEGKAVLSEIFDHLIPMMNPFAPHISEELWETLGNDSLLVDSPWPGFAEELTVRDETEIVFQVNGKIRAKLNVPSDISKEDMEKTALENERIKEMTDGKP
jgi:leucyl-tRNA synthetase